VSNAISLSPDLVQRAVDQASHFNLLAIPARDAPDPAITGPAGGVIGFACDHVLHRFMVSCRPATPRTPIASRVVMGEPVARIACRWMFVPEGATPEMGHDPRPTVLDSTRSQRFVMLDTVCTFTNDDDGFLGYGSGLTLPLTTNGAIELHAMAVGTIVRGCGRFKNHEEGTYVLCGQLSPRGEFTGNFLLRVMDRDETFSAEDTLPTIDARGEAERDVTYIVFRGQAVPSDPVTPRIGPDGKPNGLIVEQGLRLLDLDAVGRPRPRSTQTVGPMIGRITANVTFNPFAPGGSVRDPIPFTSVDEFVFHDAESGQRVGTFTADSTEGRVFRTQVLGQPGIRFGGVGRIHGGTGVFKDIRGLMTDNSVVMFEPHVSASVYVLRVHDPDGRFSSRVFVQRRNRRSKKEDC
jgi:hypothetical protein